MHLNIGISYLGEMEDKIFIDYVSKLRTFLYQPTEMDLISVAGLL